MWTELKHRIAKLNNLHFPGDRPNVFLFSTPRGGSTWLMELVLTQPGFKPANEPFNLRERFVAGELARRGIREWSDLYQSENEPGIYDYIRGIAGNWVSPGFGVTTAAPSGCSRSLVVKGI